MSTAQQQLASIQRSQSLTMMSAAAEDVPNPVSFILRTHGTSTASDLQKAAGEVLASIQFDLSPLFQDEDHPEFFVLDIHEARFDALPGSPFDLAYYIREQMGLRSVEPALETDFSDWAIGGAEGEEAFAVGMFKGFCFEGDEPDPDQSDLNWALRNVGVDKARADHGVDGSGIVIAHIDTGIAQHIETRNIDVANGLNLFGDSPGATDPLRSRPGQHPGHGTATSSVIVSQGAIDSHMPPGFGRITGSAPGATLFPIRAIKSVIRLNQKFVARAVDDARKTKAHIITMSLGGIWSDALKVAIQKAVDENIVVLAAAGNCVREVVYPARYDVCLAVAGTNESGIPWKGSCRGEEVDFSAPGEFVWCARRTRKSDAIDGIGAGQGTSFAVALSAGVAALWLQRHGRDALIQGLKPGDTLQSLFWKLARDTAIKGTLPKSMGAGLLQAHRLLDEPISDRPEIMAASSIRSEPGSSLSQDTLAILTGSDEADFGSASIHAESADAGEIEPVALEIMWRIFLEARQKSLSDPAPPLPPRSEMLSRFCAENARIGPRVP